MARTIRSISFDARKQEKNKFKASSNAEREFYKQLKKVAKISGGIIDKHVDGASIKDNMAMVKALKAYSEEIGPWAIRQSEKLLDQVSRSNKRAYQNKSKNMGKLLDAHVASSEMGKTAMALLNEQVVLIKSIPLEAGLRAQDIAARNFFEGTRASPDKAIIDQLVNEMGMTTEVATNRAKLIARTETTRANSSFVQARAIAIQSPGYIWRSSFSPNSRPSHTEMDGQFVRWDSPPLLSDGTRGHAGTFPNCLCYQDPVLPEDY